MTELLYYTDAYLYEARAKVLAVEGKKILLEKTIFFSKTSDQDGDVGRIDGIPLLGTVKQDADVWHILESDHRLRVGDTALLQLDSRKRQYKVRIHTAIHLLTGMFKKYFGLYPMNTKINGSIANIEFAKEIGIQTIGEALEKTNAFIAAGADVETYPDESSKAKKTAARIGYFPEFSCDGLFVKNIKEIGIISLENAGMSHEVFVLAVKVE